MSRTGKSKSVIDGWLQAGVDVWHSAEKSVENGLADSIIKTVRKKGTNATIAKAESLLAEAKNEAEMVDAYCSIRECIESSHEVNDNQNKNILIESMNKLFAKFPALSSLFGTGEEKVVDAGASDNQNGGPANVEAAELSTQKIIEAFEKDGYSLVESKVLTDLDAKVLAVLEANKLAAKAVEDAEAATVVANADVLLKQSEIDAKIIEVDALKAEKVALEARIVAVEGEQAGQGAADPANVEDELEVLDTSKMSPEDRAAAILLRAQGIDLNAKRKVAQA